MTGPRQVGKTTVIRKVLEELGQKVLFLNGDDPVDRNLLTDINTSQLKELLMGHQCVFVDEVQRIPGFGLTAKLIHDHIVYVQLVLSGSSAFEIGELMQEPLTGRKWVYRLLPLSWVEYQQHFGYLESERLLETRLVYGMFPEVMQGPKTERISSWSLPRVTSSRMF